MIAAAWSHDGRIAVDDYIARLTRSVGDPSAVKYRGDGGALLAWTSIWNAQRSDDGVHLGGTSLATAPFENACSLRWERGGIVCSRGPLGGEPLYWAREGRTWLACSRLEPLLRALHEAPPPDLDHLACIAAASEPAELTSTPYRGISRLLACTELHVPSGTFASTHRAAAAHARGTPESEPFDEVHGSPDVLADGLREAAYDAVARAMDGARVVGVLAGGGLDSSGLLALAVAHARERGATTVVPIALDFAGKGDDRPYLRRLEEALGIEVLRVPPEAAATLADTLVVDGRPVLYPSIPLVAAAVSRARERGVERVLSGFLGDLVLAAPGGALFERARRGGSVDPREAWRAALSALRMRVPWTSTPSSRLREELVSPLLRSVAPRPLINARRRRRLTAGIPWAGPRVCAQVARAVASRPSPPLPRTPADRFDILARSSQALDQIESRLQLEILTGVRFREPWLDARFVAAVARIRPWDLSHEDRDRGLFRHALRGRVPEEVRLRGDKAHVEPAFDRMLAAAGERVLLRHLQGPHLTAERLIDSESLARLVTRFERRAADDGGELWTSAWSLASVEATLAQWDRA